MGVLWGIVWFNFGMVRIIFGFFVLVGVVRSALSCAMVSDLDGRVNITAERALIVWDSVKKEQHFFRSLNFSSDRQSVGFIVPTPSVPVVADADERLFDHLEKLAEDLRPIEYHWGRVKAESPQILSMPGSKGGARGFGSDELPVKVHAEYKLASFDVKVIEASNIEPLNQWLAEKKFEMRPALSEWLTKYIEQKWVFVVFQFRNESKGGSFSSKNVRLSFQTPEPIYPYREPADSPLTAGRNLKLHFLSDTQYEPSESLSSWSGPEFSHKVRARARELTPKFDHLFWLTTWNDRTTERRPDGDIVFKASADPTPKLLPTNHIYILDDLYARSQVLGSYILFFGTLTLAFVFIVAVLYGIYRLLKKGIGFLSKNK